MADTYKPADEDEEALNGPLDNESEVSEDRPVSAEANARINRAVSTP